MQDLLKHFEDADPEKITRLTRVLCDFHPFLVVNMVKSNTDLKYAEIIGSMCHTS